MHVSQLKKFKIVEMHCGKGFQQSAKIVKKDYGTQVGYISIAKTKR
jgi:hypothetical protein